MTHFVLCRFHRLNIPKAKSCVHGIQTVVSSKRPKHLKLLCSNLPITIPKQPLLFTFATFPPQVFPVPCLTLQKLNLNSSPRYFGYFCTQPWAPFDQYLYLAFIMNDCNLSLFLIYVYIQTNKVHNNENALSLRFRPMQAPLLMTTDRWHRAAS